MGKIEIWDCSSWREGGLGGTGVYKYLKGGCKEETVRLFSVVCSDGRRDNGLKLKFRKFCLNMRERGKFLL